MRTYFFTKCLFLAFIVVSCTKVEDNLLSGKTITKDASNITNNSATSGGIVTITYKGSENTHTFGRNGIIWNTNQTNLKLPPTNGNVAYSTTLIGEGEFTCEMTNLLSGTLYYVQAFTEMYSPNKVEYYFLGDIKNFTTSGIAPNFMVPSIETVKVNNVTSNSMEITIRVNAYGGTNNLDEFGFVISDVDTNPVISSSKSSAFYSSNPRYNPDLQKNYTFTLSKANSGSFNIKSKTTYYIRAYATNTKGTGYGEVIEVKTL